ncbi:MAG TPA: glycosyltransferase family 1 protein [Planctomycetota bacterium]|nr:glycosyltransferase family 1 protein [Planctomycetota bacterium]
MTVAVALDYRPAMLRNAGIPRAVRELAHALAAQPGLLLHLFAHSLAAARRSDRLPANARLHRLPIPGRSLPLLRRCGLGADRLAGGASVFHWTDYVYPPVTRAVPVLTVHDLAFARDPSFHGRAQADELLRRTRGAAALARAIIVPSAATAEDVRAVLQPTAPVHVVPFGVDHVPEVTGPHPLGGQPYALAIGTVEPRKNHLRLLAAWQRLPRPRPLLVVVGRTGWECEAAAQALLAAQSDGDLRWYERASDPTIWGLLAHAEVLLYPSLYEGFGFPPLEAMALGVPVVAGDRPAIRESCDDAALYCEPTDESSIAAAIERALGDVPLRTELCARGRRRAARFTWNACARAHAAIYREVAG